MFLINRNFRRSALAKMTSAALALTAITPLSAQSMHTLEFDDTAGSKPLSEMGVRVTVQTIVEDEWTSRAIAAVEIPGYPLKMVEFGASSVSNYQVGIGPLSVIDPAPSVILKGFSGGAHCCFETIIVRPQQDRLNVLNLGSYDAASDFDAFPTDLDGDGERDFLMADGSFLYAFTNYAASWAPPKIVNIYKGNVVDVSDEPGFRPIFEDYSAKAKAACSDAADDYRNGACAAFVASEIRLGRQTEALALADKHAFSGPTAEFPSECKVEFVDWKCPKGQEIAFSAFYPAIRWFLRKHGYLE